MERFGHKLIIESSVPVSFSKEDLDCLFLDPELNEGDVAAITESILKEQSEVALDQGKGVCSNDPSCSMTRAVIMLARDGVQSDTSAAQVIYRCTKCAEPAGLLASSEVLINRISRFIGPDATSSDSSS